jgi:hypothetical protein
MIEVLFALAMGLLALVLGVAGAMIVWKIAYGQWWRL